MFTIGTALARPYFREAHVNDLLQTNRLYDFFSNVAPATHAVYGDGLAFMFYLASIRDTNKFIVSPNEEIGLLGSWLGFSCYTDMWMIPAAKQLPKTVVRLVLL